MRVDQSGCTICYKYDLMLYSTRTCLLLLTAWETFPSDIEAHAKQAEEAK